MEALRGAREVLLLRHRDEMRELFEIDADRPNRNARLIDSKD
jgi:hypothetical protein